MLLHFSYLFALCAIILITFFTVLMPQPLTMPTADLQAMQLMHHITMDSPSPQFVLLVCIGGLVYLKIIWRLINPPQR